MAEHERGQRLVGRRAVEHPRRDEGHPGALPAGHELARVVRHVAGRARTVERIGVARVDVPHRAVVARVHARAPVLERDAVGAERAPDLAPAGAVVGSAPVHREQALGEQRERALRPGELVQQGRADLRDLAAVDDRRVRAVAARDLGELLHRGAEAVDLDAHVDEARRAAARVVAVAHLDVGDVEQPIPSAHNRSPAAVRDVLRRGEVGGLVDDGEGRAEVRRAPLQQEVAHPPPVAVVVHEVHHQQDLTVGVGSPAAPQVPPGSA